jgi:hypothetical protein
MPLVRKHGRGERERDRRVVRRAAKRQGVEDPLDLGPLVKGKWKGGDTASLISPTHNSFSASGWGSSVEWGYGRRTSTEAPPGRGRVAFWLA